MSVKLKLSSLSPTERSKLSSDLIFTPKNRVFRGKRRWAFTPASKPPILGFRVDQGIVKIPMAYGKKNYLDRIIPNPVRASYPINFTGQLYEDQSIQADQAWKHLQTTGGIILALYTGAGKTVVSAELSTRDPGLTLILCASTTLLSQWEKTFHDFTDAKVWIVGETLPTEANVIICMDTRFNKLPDDYLLRIKMLIVDEAHCFPTPTRFPCFLKLEPKYIVAATATPKRSSDGLFSAIEAVTGTEKIIKISTKPFKVMKYETGIKIETKLNKQGIPDWNHLVSTQCNSQARNDLILEIVSMNHNQGSKILILTWRDEHVRLLEKMVAATGILVDRMSKNKKTYHDSDVLVGTIAKIGTGFDEKNVCADFNGIRIDLLILVGSMSSVELLEQVAGRVFRAEFPSIIHFCDDNPTSRKHWKETAVDWYQSRNGIITICQNKGDRVNQPPTPTILARQQLAKFQAALNNNYIEASKSQNLEIELVIED